MEAREVPADELDELLYGATIRNVVLRENTLEIWTEMVGGGVTMISVEAYVMMEVASERGVTMRPLIQMTGRSVE